MLPVLIVDGHPRGMFGVVTYHIKWVVMKLITRKIFTNTGSGRSLVRNDNKHIVSILCSVQMLNIVICDNPEMINTQGLVEEDRVHFVLNTSLYFYHRVVESILTNNPT